MNSKIQTYIGFAIKKGSAVFGCDQIKSCRKRIYLILFTEDLSPNSQSVLRSVSERVQCPLLQIETYQFLQSKNCKALAICDKSLAGAITENLMYMPREEK